MGPPALLPIRRKLCCGFLSPLKSIASAGFEPAILGSSGKNTNHNTTEATPALSLQTWRQKLRVTRKLGIYLQNYNTPKLKTSLSFVVFLSPSRRMLGLCLKIRPRPLPFTSFPIHNSLITAPCLLNSSLNRSLEGCFVRLPILIPDILLPAFSECV
jgi:hypothetical protein